MNKRQLIDDAITLNERNLSKADMAEALDCLLNSIAGELRAGGKVELKNFGAFGTKVRSARTGRNPQTGESMQIPEKTVAFCKLSSKILE